MSSKWKKAFFILASFNILALIFILYLAFRPSSSPVEKREVQGQDQIEIELQLSGEELEGLFNSKVQSMDLPITLEIGQDFSFIRPLEVMGQKTQIRLRGDPRIREDGRIEILVSQVTMGDLVIPKGVGLGALEAVLGAAKPILVEGESLVLDTSSLSQDFSLKPKKLSPKEDIYIFVIGLEKSQIFN